MAKILVVDDEPNNRYLLEVILKVFQEKGVGILYAVDGKEGLELILREKPDLVFLDIMLPEMDGYEVCSRTKKTHGLTQVYIVLLTARSRDSIHQKAADAGADMTIYKPFKVLTIVDTVQKVLGIKA